MSEQDSDLLAMLDLLRGDLLRTFNLPPDQLAKPTEINRAQAESLDMLFRRLYIQLQRRWGRV